MPFAQRRARVRDALDAASARPAAVFTDLSDIRYLTGFSGSNAVLVVGADPADDLLATDGRYEVQVAAQCPGLPVLIDRATLAAVGRHVAQWTIVADERVSVADARLLPASTTFLPSLVTDMRMRKDPGELALIATACSITARAMTELAGTIRAGQTEVSIARRLEALFAEGGADERAFETIVASGPNTAVPHHQPGPRELSPGDLVVIDAGAKVQGYCADMTRTFVVGEPADWQVRVHADVLAAQQAASRAYLPGTPCQEIDSIAREALRERGWDKEFGHGLGHGLGLDIHEAPMVAARPTGSIDADMAITVEPGVYLPGRGGVRIEDTLAVTSAGPVVLTEASRDLIRVG